MMTIPELERELAAANERNKELEQELTATKWALESANAHMVPDVEVEKRDERLFQMQNAAIDLAKKNVDLETRLACVRAETLEECARLCSRRADSIREGSTVARQCATDIRALAAVPPGHACVQIDEDYSSAWIDDLHEALKPFEES